MKKEKKSISMPLNSRKNLTMFFALILLATASAFGEEELFKRFPVAKLRETPKNIFDLKRNFSKLKKDHLEELVRFIVQGGGKNRQAGSLKHKKVSDTILNALNQIDTNKAGLVTVDSFTPDLKFAITQYQNDFKEKVAAHYEVSSDFYLKGRAFTDSIVNFLKEKSKDRNLIGRNIIWEKKGTLRPKELIVITAHYDTMTVKSVNTSAKGKKESNLSKVIDPEGVNPGADDNASGVGVALALIKVIAQMDVPVTIRFVFLDWEEWRGLGSKAYFKKYQGEGKRVLGFLNLESLGHDSKSSDKERRHRNMRAYLSRPDKPYYQKEKVFVDALLEKGRKGVGQPIFKAVANDQVFEGHMGRWQDEIPAVTFSQNWQDDPNDKRIHTSNDFVETLNFTTLHKATRFIGIGLLSYLYNF